MQISRFIRPLVLAAVAAAATAAVPAAQQANVVTVPLTDPARPASIRVSMHAGGIVIKGGDRRDILVTARGGDNDDRRRRSEPPAGLRRLNQAAGLTITEDNNEVTISPSPFNREGDIEVQVPARVNLKLSAHNNGDIIVDNVEGDIEVTNHNNDIRLTNVRGSVVASSHNGDVRVVLTRITAEKAMAFTSFNGDVDVTLPATAKANLRLRSDRGDIFTDFDVQMRQGTPSQQTRRDGTTRIEMNQAIYGAINGGGAELELRTYNGDIFVRRGGQ